MLCRDRERKRTALGHAVCPEPEMLPLVLLSLVTFLSSASTALSMQNNCVFGDLKSDEMELLYSAYGDETGVQCALR